jgi:hypothetical protein
MISILCRPTSDREFMPACRFSSCKQLHANLLLSPIPQIRRLTLLGKLCLHQRPKLSRYQRTYQYLHWANVRYNSHGGQHLGSSSVLRILWDASRHNCIPKSVISARRCDILHHRPSIVLLSSIMCTVCSLLPSHAVRKLRW